jgi:hypothetical protein
MVFGSIKAAKSAVGKKQAKKAGNYQFLADALTY